MPITTSESLDAPKGFYCANCKQRSPILEDGLCPACFAGLHKGREPLVKPAPDRPADGKSS